MKNIARLLFVALLTVGATISGKAHVYVGDGEPSRGSRDLKQTTAGCSPSSAFECSAQETEGTPEHLY